MGTRRARLAGAVLTTAALAAACSSGSGDSNAAAPSSSTTTTNIAGFKGDGSSAGGGAIGGPAPTLSGPVTVGLTFNPATDGFSFENYGNVEGRPNLTAAELQRFFGDAVCGSTAGGTCTLTPPAQQWVEAVNASMNGGHCEGMAVLALLLNKGLLKASDFGGDTANALKVDGNDKLAREIAYWYTTQGTSPTRNAELNTLKPSEVVDKLKESFQPGASETYTLGIYKTVDGKKKEGHAITPFGLVDAGNGKFEIAVYDNNFPGQTRAVTVDTGAQTWQYASATNPNEPTGLYAGDATTGSLTLTPTSIRQQPQTCPFCGGDASAAGGARGSAAGASTTGAGPDAAPSATPSTPAGPTSYVFLDPGSAEKGVTIEITTPDGQPYPGVSSTAIKSNLAAEDAAPIIEVPGTAPFKVKLVTTDVTGETKADLTIVGQDLDAYVDGITVKAGDTDSVEFTPATGALVYETTSAETPDVGIGFDGQGADYGFRFGGVDLPQGGRIEASVDRAAGTASLRNAAAAPGTYAVAIDRIDDKGDSTFSHDGVELPAGATLSLGYAAWPGDGQALSATVDAGSGPDTQTYDDQPG